MTLPINRIPTADLFEVFPGIGENLPLEVSSSIFSFRPWEMPLALSYEQLALPAIVRYLRPRRLLEFGTAQGQTTLSLAANSPPDAEVYTLDIANTTEYKRQCLRGDTDLGQYFRDSVHRDKIRQLLRDGTDDLPAPLSDLKGGFDFIHVDADHGYAGVRADTLAALECAAPDAVITWHDFYTFPDYVRQDRERRGVFPWLNEFAAETDLVLRHIVGTYLVVGSRRWPRDLPGHVLQPGDTPAPFGQRIVRLAETGWPQRTG
jgi:predicted O-methyltransferase YrrM